MLELPNEYSKVRVGSPATRMKNTSVAAVIITPAADKDKWEDNKRNEIRVSRETHPRPVRILVSNHSLKRRSRASLPVGSEADHPPVVRTHKDMRPHTAGSKYNEWHSCVHSS